MRNKKLLSSVVVAALAVSTMAVPVMAAGESGSIDVDLTTKKGVLRVEVPTEMAIAVDQFEIAQTGAQIASGEFNMVNKSEMAVKVEVTSTATLGTGISLVQSVNAAETSTGDEAWLAVAAKTGATSYDNAATDDVTENSYDLTEANANVKTFGTDKTAKQTFYLGKGSGSASYALAIPSGNKASVSYAEFYELKALDTQPTDDATLQTAVNANDVYAVVTADNAKDKAVVTKIAKGTTVAGGANAWANTNTYYNAAEEPSAVADGKKYVYGTMGTAGEAAGFTYVGKLSNAKETWTKDDIKKINIAYTIKGVTGTKFNEVKDDCTYGLYKDDAGPSIAQKTYTMTAGQAISIPVNLGSGDKAASKVTDIKFGGASMIATNMASYDSATKTVTITKAAVDYFTGSSYSESSAKVSIEFDKGSSIEITLNK